MKKNVQWLLLFGAFLITTPSAVCADSDPPALRRAKEYIEMINGHDKVATKAYVENNYSPEYLKMPMPAHISFINELWDHSRGLKFNSVKDSSATNAIVIAQTALLGDWLWLNVRVEEQPPHGIVDLNWQPTRAPASVSLKPLTDAEKAKELEVYIQKLAENDLFSGVALLAKDDKILFEKAYGQANKDFNAPNKIDTKFNLGSMNKMFTAVAIARLAEQGKLSFEDSLAKFIQFPNAALAPKIRLKHLLSHTSGLGSYFNEEFMKSSRALFRTVDDYLQLAQNDSLAFEPGTNWSYSNTGFMALGAVIEKVSGQTYDDFIRENITKPTGMTGTDCYALDAVNPNLAVGYQREFTASGVSYRNNIFEHVIKGGPAGGGYSTVEDLFRFARALQSGKLVGQEYVKQLQSAKPELNSPRYGFGFGVSGDKRIVGHSGGFEGISSNLDIFTDSGYTAVVLSNYGAVAMRVQMKLRDLVLGK